MKENKRIIVLTDQGQVIPLNVSWVGRFSTPTNIKRYVAPIVGRPFVAAICRGFTWIGHNEWSCKYDSLPRWKSATSMQEKDNTLWI